MVANSRDPPRARATKRPPRQDPAAGFVKEPCMSRIIARFVAGLAALSISAPLMLGSATPVSADTRSNVAAGLFGGAVGVMVGAAAASAARPAPPPVVVYERPAP